MPRQHNYTIWTLAGTVALTALITALSLRPSAADIDPTPSPERIQKPTAAPRIDVVFTIDATGSMGDELAVVKKEIWSIANKLMEGSPRPDIRFGLVFYQDRGDSFLVKKTELTRDVDAVHSTLMAITAGGGGDWREHVGRGLHEAVHLDWDSAAGVTRLMYLVGDAPGHDDYQDGYNIDAAVNIARTKDIKINVIGCSGIGDGQREFEAIAQNAGGAYTTLTYEAIVTDDDGTQRSVIYYDGEMYEADEVLDKKDWGRGGDALIKEGRVRKARPAMRRKAAAPGAATRNNLDDVVFDDVKGAAEGMGVEFE